ncbi:MAG: hypothetical protein H6682_03090 [Candidatus Eisenbacteria bacterium]|nr:hypothetical protein [Candidatus Eisenbacteria bacterium]
MIKNRTPLPASPSSAKRLALSACSGLVLFLGLAALLATSAAAAVPGLVVRDNPDDRGEAILVEWDGEAAGDSVRVERAESEAGPWVMRRALPGSAARFVDQGEGGPERGKTYFYRVNGQVLSATPTAQWWNKGRTNLFLILALYLGLIMVFLNIARKGGSLFIRKIAGLDAMEEAIGRATEMGKPVLYVPGIDDANNIQTIYSMAILNSVAKMVAQYDTELIVPLAKAFVLPLAEETVRSGYMDVGRPDSFRADNIRFLSDEQFAFTAAVNGIMLREKPAANLFLGSFFAESLVLAETGFTTGAIQIAGTANIHQLPFFVVACDYTMIGEEFFATSAYLSREPMLVGTLKGGDMMKLVIMVFLVVAAIAATMGHSEAFRSLLVIR